MALSTLFSRRFFASAKPARQRRPRPLTGWEQLGHSITGLESLENRLLMAVDLGVSFAAEQAAYYTPGTQSPFTIQVTNFGDTAVTGAQLTTGLSSLINQSTWTVAFTGGATGQGATSGVGQLNQTLSLPAGSSVIYRLIGQIGASATGDLTSSATITAADDAVLANNTANNTRAFVAKAVAVTDDAGWTSTGTVKVVSPAGTVLSQFNAFAATYRGGVHTAMGDLQGNGNTLIAAAPGRGLTGEVRVFTLAGQELPQYRLLPFGANWHGGVNVALADVNNDGLDDIIAAKATGSGEVRVFLSRSQAGYSAEAFRTFLPFGKLWTSGATVAAADLGTFPGGAANVLDGKAEVIVGSGAGAAPQVKVFDISTTTPTVLDTIVPFTGSKSLGGVSVAVGRVNADDVADIIVSAGRQGGSKTEIYDGTVATAANAKLASYAAFATLGRPNAPVSGAGLDTDGDGLVDTLYSAQGTGGSNGVMTVSTTGTVTGSLGSFSRPVLIAAPLAKTFPAVVTTASGLQINEYVRGTGPVAKAGQTVTANYTGQLADGTVFDSSLTRGTPFSFTLGKGQVIGGWDEAFARLPSGSKAQLKIPAPIGYGAAGSPPSIPGNATLFFDVEVISVS